MTALEPLTVTTPAGVAGVLLEIAQSALSECGAEPIETSYVAAGAIAWDSCCGLLVAAPERIYRSAVFPIEGVDATCETGLLAVEAVVLLLRCIPVLDDQGQAPSGAALDAAYTGLLRDAAIIWNALAADLPDGWDRANLNQIYVGAEGGCLGVETRVTIGLDQDAWCPTCPTEAP